MTRTDAERINDVCERAGRRIRQWREVKGWSQEELSTKVSRGQMYLTAGWIGRVETADLVAHITDLLYICTALGHSLAELFAEEEACECGRPLAVRRSCQVCDNDE